MVVQSKRRFPKKKPQISTTIRSNHIGRIAVLPPKPSTATMHEHTLPLLTSLCDKLTPLLAHYNFHIGLITEFYPKNSSLLGLNVNYGQKICVRLRSPGNDAWLLSEKEIMETLLHEICHCRWGPHDDNFWTFLKELGEFYWKERVERNGWSDVWGADGVTAFSGTREKSKSVLQGDTYKVNKTSGRKLGAGTKISDSAKRDLMAQAALKRLNQLKKEEKIDFIKKSSGCCGINRIDLVPKDEDLIIIDVIDLCSDDEQPGEHTFKIKSENDKRSDNDIIIID
ncbi:metalloendopeptidase [Martiniozyma asiatica (nom. inval.)]|nr:metalloendopeptidase [Martiniozyma asiatica]